MNSAAPSSFDPSVVGSVILVCVVLTACATSKVVTRAARILLETAWLYASSTRG